MGTLVTSHACQPSACRSTTKLRSKRSAKVMTAKCFTNASALAAVATSTV
eukprot:CAMPEP_0198362324 /NCGR_PEP_ID=MMETSP1450-20131203/145645_1 /TAXON_ID=753684 ORGANISM="Madagascaria erythrocladiodes, Strain CCMP3234" /NCGR_SAMPLE_ID=MMETSP1450 /ASSEMBLY_ACC=CAM_ASM_001115 /LENGTH=49 /DNA_ID= /DNA_START= /DNA_END= /DNA_ORIENTATION=